jgi:hypothetical protein
MMKKEKLTFEGIVLQPVSKKKDPWSKYNKDQNNFLEFFQTEFAKNIQNDFNVNHKTEDFSGFLLIPYFTENKNCFGAYYIKNGGKSSSENYCCKYTIDYSNSFNFIEAIQNDQILNEAEFQGYEFEKVGSTNYYVLEKVPRTFREYILKFMEEKSIS